ncbi:SMI1/KNR4 family protein [Streptomyces sp. H51]|uniref:SMI1/KNR4 family protein n=1 Tax=Streptomyces sp. H51 TaxID=3111770 RepID=UPI002D780B93|nr:SMI1/KNR4 family protein [Streptomyces sp. H51]
MPENWLERVLDMLGEPLSRYRDPAAWRELESSLGLSLPADYREIIDGYAPVQINGHLYLGHPATERWNLGEWIRSTADAWSQIDWDWAEPEGDPRASLGIEELVFGTADGLIPIGSTDRGETIFLAPRADNGNGVLFVENEGEFFEYTMTFSEWLYRWLIGEDVAGPNSSAFYPGPMALRDLPMTPDERPETRYGPPRGM